MSQGLPCINPVCDHTFSLADVRAAAALRCPRCGTVCQLGAGTSEPAPTNAAAPPVASRVPSRPAALPVATPATMPEPRLAMAAPIAARVAPEPALALELDRAPASPPFDERSTVAFAPKPGLPVPSPNEAGATVSFTPFVGSPPVAQRIESVEEQSIATESQTFPMNSTAVAEPVLFTGEQTLNAATLERRKQPQLAMWKKIVLVTALGSLLLGLPIMAILFGIFSFRAVNNDDGEAFAFTGYLYNQAGEKELAFGLGVQMDVWKQRDDFKNLLKAAVALERVYVDPQTQKEALILLTVAGQDYGKQKPRDAELIKQAITRLESCFGANLIVETTPEETTLDDKRALALHYQGALNSVDYVGTCYAVTHHGFGYWVCVMQTIPIGVDQELAQKLLAELQSQKKMGFRAVTKRYGWTERPPEMDTFDADTALVKVRTPKGQWTSFIARDFDPQGELYLHSKDKTKYHKKHEKSASVLVSKIKKKTSSLDDALSSGRDYLQARLKDENEAFKLSPIEAGTKEKPVPKQVGNQNGLVQELQMESADKDFKKYYLIAVVRRADHFYLIQFESFWPYRQAWRGDFLDILATFSVADQ